MTMELIKITPGKERAKSIVKMASLIEERIKLQERKTMGSLILADYYEVLKELITALLFVDGFKTLSHKDLIDYLSQNYKEFSIHELQLLDDLRVLRNRITYEGFNAPNSYLERNEKAFKQVITKLRSLLKKRL